MREIKHIVIHCTATSQTATSEAIKRYWRETLKWKNPGYHYLIDVVGREHHLHPEDKIANGVAGHNRNSIHVSYIGGLETDDRTSRQNTALYQRCLKLKQKYPNAEICGHRDFPGVKKSCPRFDAKSWFESYPITLTT